MPRLLYSTETVIYQQFPGPSPSLLGGDSGANSCVVKAGGGAAAANRGVEASCTVVLGLGSWVLGLGSWVLGLGSWVLGLGSWVLGLGSWVLGLGSWVGAREVSCLNIDSPKAR
jgi:hypothetical protein